MMKIISVIVKLGNECMAYSQSILNEEKYVAANLWLWCTQDPCH